MFGLGSAVLPALVGNVRAVDRKTLSREPRSTDARIRNQTSAPWGDEARTGGDLTVRKISLTEAEVDFTERMGINAEADGQARITGRIWALLMVLARDLTSAEIADTLMVSRGSVSTNLRMLENLKIIERRSRPGEREIYFGMCPHPYSALIEQFIERFANHRRMVETAAERIDRNAGRENLANLSRFYEILEQGHRAMLDEIMTADP